MRWRIVTLSILGGTLGLVAEAAASTGWETRGSGFPICSWDGLCCRRAGWLVAPRPGSGTGPLLAATGYAWFLGSFHGGVLGPIALFALYRGPLIHCVLSFPGWRPSSRFDRAAVAAGYVAAAVTPVAVSNPATIALGVLVMGAAVRAAFVSAGAARRARVAALPAAAAVGLVLAGGSAALLAGVGGDVVLAVDEVALVAVALDGGGAAGGPVGARGGHRLGGRAAGGSVRHAAGRPGPRAGGFVAAGRVLGRAATRVRGRGQGIA